MRSRLQLDVRNLSLGRCHLVNTDELKAGIGVIAGKTVRSVPAECLECEVLQKESYINTLIFTYFQFVLKFIKLKKKLSYPEVKHFVQKFHQTCRVCAVQ